MSETNAERSARESENERAFSRDRYDAVLLDLDGVITDTASVHAACWKQMFDEYLQKRASERGEIFRPFDVASDYRLYVYVERPFSADCVFFVPHDTPIFAGGVKNTLHTQRVGGLGNRKNDLV